MKVIAIALCLAAATALEVQYHTLDAKMDVEQKFGLWKAQFGKEFATIEAEAKALKNFIVNDLIILEHNAKDTSYKLGHNEFSAMSWEEFKQFMHLAEYSTNPFANKTRNEVTLDASAAPASIDWTTKGAVTPVKNQGQCGSCWAFSTTGSTEGAYAIASGNLVSLSEQMLVSCDKVDSGCNGGLMDNAFGWIKSNGGICTESSYPYTSSTGSTGTCKSTCSPQVTLTGHTDVASKDETSLKAAVANQPVSVAIEADKSAFQLYKSGVLDSSSCGTNLDHGVLVVGYGTLDGKDYWKVKNSWGASWGLNGYVLMAEGKNMCGISQQPSYPTGASGLGPVTPTPAPVPTPAPPAAASHYADPFKVACESDEVNITIQDVSGAVCSPACTGLFKMHCPSDVPSGVVATPQCALQDASSGSKYCALICSPSLPIVDQQVADTACGSDEHISCKAISGVGICTYDS